MAIPAIFNALGFLRMRLIQEDQKRSFDLIPGEVRWMTAGSLDRPLQYRQLRIQIVRVRLSVACQILPGVDLIGKRYDRGNKIGGMEAIVEMALKDKKIGEGFRAYLKARSQTL